MITILVSATLAAAAPATAPAPAPMAGMDHSAMAGMDHAKMAEAAKKPCCCDDMAKGPEAAAAHKH